MLKSRNIAISSICNDCGQPTAQTHIKDYKLKDKVLGIFIVHKINQIICNKCGAIYLPANEGKKIDAARKNEINRRLQLQPFGEMITAEEAAQILGITKQAFSKNNRIKNGFILSALKDNRKYYLRNSVLAFKKDNDGRIHLNDNAPEKNTTPLYRIMKYPKTNPYPEPGEQWKTYLQVFDLDSAHHKEATTIKPCSLTKDEDMHAYVIDLTIDSPLLASVYHPAKISTPSKKAPFELPELYELEEQMSKLISTPLPKSKPKSTQHPKTH